MANSLVKTKKKFSVAIQEDKYKALMQWEEDGMMKRVNVLMMLGLAVLMCGIAGLQGCGSGGGSTAGSYSSAGSAAS